MFIDRFGSVLLYWLSISTKDMYIMIDFIIKIVDSKTHRVTSIVIMLRFYLTAYETYSFTRTQIPKNCKLK